MRRINTGDEGSNLRNKPRVATDKRRTPITPDTSRLVIHLYTLEEKRKQIDKRTEIKQIQITCLRLCNLVARIKIHFPNENVLCFRARDNSV